MVAGGVVYAALTFWQSGKEWSATIIEVDGAEIRLVREGAIKRTVSKDRICYVRESAGNLFRGPMVVISERGPVGTRLLGGLAVPKSVPEYGQIKAQALNWLKAPKAVAQSGAVPPSV